MCTSKLLTFMFSILLFTLSGCSATVAVVEKGAEINDSALEAAEFTICQAASIGAIQRRYGDSPERWNALCKPKDISPIVGN